MAETILKSVLTCPACGHQATEPMPTDACQYFYQCLQCDAILQPKGGGDRCVFVLIARWPARPSSRTMSAVIRHRANVVLQVATQSPDPLKMAVPRSHRVIFKQYVRFRLKRFDRREAARSAFAKELMNEPGNVGYDEAGNLVRTLGGSQVEIIEPASGQGQPSN